MFNKNGYRDVIDQSRDAKLRIAHVQQQLQNNPLDSRLISLEKAALLDLHKASHAYEQFLHQKSKITWLRLSDDCTGYFHAAMKSRDVKNRILSFVQNGTRIEDFNQVVDHFLNHFKTFMGTTSSASGFVN